jgi:hypothetical protein
MQYALLFYSPPLSRLPEAEREARVGEMLDAMRVWLDEATQAGVFRSTLRLAPATEAVSVRGQGGKLLATDGPFAETKEILGGLAILDCKTRDEALAWARRCPLNRIGTVELRPEWGAAGG